MFVSSHARVHRQAGVRDTEAAGGDGNGAGTRQGGKPEVEQGAGRCSRGRGVGSAGAAHADPTEGHRAAQPAGALPTLGAHGAHVPQQARPPRRARLRSAVAFGNHGRAASTPGAEGWHHVPARAAA